MPTPATLPWERNLILTVQEAGWARLEGWRKSCPPKGSDPRTVQPVASHYTHYAILDRAHYHTIFNYRNNDTHLSSSCLTVIRIKMSLVLIGTENLHLASILLLGVFCEIDVAVCNTTGESRCMNGGICIEGPGESYTCSCQAGTLLQYYQPSTITGIYYICLIQVQLDVHDILYFFRC
jgi:hypothetical protein